MVEKPYTQPCKISVFANTSDMIQYFLFFVSLIKRTIRLSVSHYHFQNRDVCRRIYTECHEMFQYTRKCPSTADKSDLFRKPETMATGGKGRLWGGGGQCLKDENN